VSRLNDLIRQLRLKDAALADDLEREVSALADRRAFGLNFERHVPEAVELPGRRVRRGDKVRILPPRGTMPKKSDEKLWQVTAIEKQGDSRLAMLEAMDGEETATGSLDDLVVVAEFRDPIYPGLVSTGRVERGGDKPFHSVINAENYHALQTLLFTHRGRVDCIYIDPPYNTGAKDWKYNNDYVEGDDLYRHSKWLAFIERRLLLAKELLNQDDSVLIVTIDEKEYLRLGLLLEQTFPTARVTMVSSVINSKGSARTGTFRRTDEYVYFVMFGSAAPCGLELSDEWRVVSDARAQSLRWATLQRQGANGRRIARPNLFYPIFVRDADGAAVFHSVGEAFTGAGWQALDAPVGTVGLWPIRGSGEEGTWSVSPQTLRDLISKGYVRLGAWRGAQTTVTFLTSGEQAKIESAVFPVQGRRSDGSVIVDDTEYSPRYVPGTQWRIASHNAGGSGGVGMIRSLLPDRTFPYPKSVYAVEDALRFFVEDKPDALILDFFAGSGTTTHAVMRLNRQNAGRRASICITNNEVAAEEQRRLRDARLRPGDADWEARGICDHITQPRLAAAITGDTSGGGPVKGDYKFIDEFPMADGFEENVEFFTLTYEAPLRVANNREFERVAPLLWLRAGSRGRRIDDISSGWDVADAYGVLADLDQVDKFLAAMADHPEAAIAFVVTDEDRLFQSVVRELPDGVEPVRLYEAYLRNFEIEAGRGAR
jgi:adenine-specific DNA-methyltransferase